MEQLRRKRNQRENTPARPCRIGNRMDGTEDQSKLVSSQEVHKKGRRTNLSRVRRRPEARAEQLDFQRRVREQLMQPRKKSSKIPLIKRCNMEENENRQSAMLNLDDISLSKFVMSPSQEKSISLRSSEKQLYDYVVNLENSPELVADDNQASPDARTEQNEEADKKATTEDETSVEKNVAQTAVENVGIIDNTQMVENVSVKGTNAKEETNTAPQKHEESKKLESNPIDTKEGKVKQVEERIEKKSIAENISKELQPKEGKVTESATKEDDTPTKDETKADKGKSKSEEVTPAVVSADKKSIKEHIKPQKTENIPEENKNKNKPIVKETDKVVASEHAEKRHEDRNDNLSTAERPEKKHEDGKNESAGKKAEGGVSKPLKENTPMKKEELKKIPSKEIEKTVEEEVINKNEKGLQIKKTDQKIEETREKTEIKLPIKELDKKAKDEGPKKVQKKLPVKELEVSNQNFDKVSKKETENYKLGNAETNKMLDKTAEKKRLPSHKVETSKKAELAKESKSEKLVKTPMKKETITRVKTEQLSKEMKKEFKKELPKQIQSEKLAKDPMKEHIKRVKTEELEKEMKNESKIEPIKQIRSEKSANEPKQESIERVKSEELNKELKKELREETIKQAQPEKLAKEIKEVELRKVETTKRIKETRSTETKELINSPKTESQKPAEKEVKESESIKKVQLPDPKKAVLIIDKFPNVKRILFKFDSYNVPFAPPEREVKFRPIIKVSKRSRPIQKREETTEIQERADFILSTKEVKNGSENNREGRERSSVLVKLRKIKVEPAHLRPANPTGNRLYNLKHNSTNEIPFIPNHVQRHYEQYGKPPFKVKNLQRSHRTLDEILGKK